MRTTRVIQWAAVLAILSLAGVVQGSITYSVDGWGPTSYLGSYPPPEGAPHASYPGDTVSLSGASGILDTGLNTHMMIGTLHWLVDWTYNGTDNNLSNDGPPPLDWPELQFVVDTSRGISFGGGGGGTLSQTGLLTTDWYDDWLLMNLGATQSYSAVVSGEIYNISVTPAALGAVDVTYWNGNPPCAARSGSFRRHIRARRRTRSRIYHFHHLVAARHPRHCRRLVATEPQSGLN